MRNESGPYSVLVLYDALGAKRLAYYQSFMRCIFSYSKSLF
jgi:hypothetical protein